MYERAQTGQGSPVGTSLYPAHPQRMAWHGMSPAVPLREVG